VAWARLRQLTALHGGQLHGKDTADQAFAGVDANRDGRITWDEWMHELFHEDAQEPVYIDGAPPAPVQLQRGRRRTRSATARREVCGLRSRVPAARAARGEVGGAREREDDTGGRRRPHAAAALPLPRCCCCAAAALLLLRCCCCAAAAALLLPRCSAPCARAQGSWGR
jgi:hypothetical protein